MTLKNNSGATLSRFAPSQTHRTGWNYVSHLTSLILSLNLPAQVTEATNPNAANVSVNFNYMVLGLLALGMFLGACEWLRRSIPGRIDWDRIVFLFGRIIFHSAWVYAVLSFYTRTWRHFNMPKALSIQWLTLILLALWWIVRRRVRAPRSPFMLPGAWFGLMLVGMCLFGVNMAEGWEDLTKFLASVAFVILGACFLHRLHDMRLFAALLGGVSIVVAAYGLGQWFDWPLCHYAPRIASFEDIPRFLGGVWRLLTGDTFLVQLPAGQFTELRDLLRPGFDPQSNLVVPVTTYWTKMPQQLLELVLQQDLGMQDCKFTWKNVSFMGNENYNAEFINMALPVCLCMVFYYWGRPLGMAFFSFASMANLISMTYTDTNASYVGMAATLPILFFVLLFTRGVPWIVQSGLIPRATHRQVSQWVRTGTFTVVLLVSLGAAILASVPNPVRNTIATRLSWIDVNGDYMPDGAPPQIFRLECMDSALRAISDCFPLGIGPGNFKVIHPRFESQLERKVLGKETLARKVHNDVLQHALEYGVLGMFGFIWMWTMVYSLIFGTLSTLRREEMGASTSRRGPPLPVDDRRFAFYLMIGCLGAVTMVLVSCNFGHTFAIPGSMVVFYSFACIVGATHQRIHHPAPTRAVPKALEPVEERGTKLSELRVRFWSLPPLVRWAVLLPPVLLFGVLAMRQMIGETYLKEGMAFHDVKKYKSMLFNMTKAEQVWPYQMETYYILGRYCIDAYQDLDNAEIGRDDYVRQVIQANPGQTADEVWKRVVTLGYELEPDEKELWLLRGIRALQTDIFMNPNYKWAHNNLGVLYEKLSTMYIGREGPEFSRALSLYARNSYARTLSLDEEQIYGLFNTGLGFLKEENSAAAIPPFEKSLAVDPQKTEVLLYISGCYINNKDHENAFLAIERFVELSGLHPDAPWTPDVLGPQIQPTVLGNYVTLASTFAGKGELVQAALCFKRSLQAQPDLNDPRYLQGYGQVLSLAPLSKYASAAELFQQVVDLTDNDPDLQKKAMRFLVVNSVNANKTPAEILPLIERWLLIEPEDPKVRMNLARVKLQIGGTHTVNEIGGHIFQALQLGDDSTVNDANADPLIQHFFRTYPNVPTFLQENGYDIKVTPAPTQSATQ